MAVRRNAVKRGVGPALYAVMEPGDQIIAGTLATEGPGPWPEMLAVPLCLALPVGGFTTGASTVPFWDFGAILLSLVILYVRRPAFVAVTQRQLICYRLSRSANAPVRLLFRAPLPLVRVTSLRRPALNWRSILYDGPGVEGGSLRLHVIGRWRRDLDEVLTALHAEGARVAGLPPAQPAPLGKTFSQRN